jgi:aryl-alcohol dehydrogenase-like predicted oxidoreductase
VHPETVFDGDDLRRSDPKFLEPRFAQYLAAVAKLDRIAQRFGKRVIHLAVRWMLDQGITTALWAARHPGQLQPVDEVTGRSLERLTANLIVPADSASISEASCAPAFRDQVHGRGI